MAKMGANASALAMFLVALGVLLAIKCQRFVAMLNHVQIPDVDVLAQVLASWPLAIAAAGLLRLQPAGHGSYKHYHTAAMISPAPKTAERRNLG